MNTDERHIDAGKSDSPLTRADVDQLLRTVENTAQLDLRFQNLQQIDLSYMDLQGVNLQGADLRRAKLRGTNLQGAHLQEADLSEADLDGADLSRAQLGDTDANRVKLHGAKFSYAILRELDLHGFNLTKLDLRHADLNGTDLRGAVLYGADLQEADLSTALLHGPELQGAILHRGVFFHDSREKILPNRLALTQALSEEEQPSPQKEQEENQDKLIQIRRFSPDLKIKIPGNHPGLYGVPIQINNTQIPPEKLEAFAKRVNGMPLLVDAPLQVEAMYFDPHASIEEHSADHPILFLVISGQGSVRIGGPSGEICQIQTGDAILWPAHIDHTVWTDNDSLHAIVINTFSAHEHGTDENTSGEDDTE